MRSSPIARMYCLGLATLLAATAAGTVYAEPLTGDVGAAYSTPDGVAKNPANAGFLDRTQIGFNPNLFTSESYLIRYPGSPSAATGQSGANIPPLAIPNAIVKLTPHFGIGGIVVPPGITLPVAIKRIPIVVLGEPNYVDINGTATVQIYGSVVAGWRPFENFGIGLSAAYASAAVHAELTPSDGGATLITISGNATTLDVVSGLRWDLVPGRFAIGAAFGLIKMQDLALTVDSPLLAQGGGADGGISPTGNASSNVQNPLDSFLVGVQLGLSPKFRILADLLFTRAPANAETFSIVELRKKKRDVHDVLAFHGGIILSLTPTANAMLGGVYQPASVGPGGRGEDSLAGFGTLDVVQTFLPMIGEELKPYWQVGAGVQYGFVPKGNTDKPHPAYYTWTVATGMVYRRASLGIDENGEQPGAYLRTTTTIPLQLTYRF